MQKGFYHLLRRKRFLKKIDPYPHPLKWKRFLDDVIFIVAILGPLALLPQAIKIWNEKNALGLSFTTWIISFLCCIPWLIYGIVHKEKPIIYANLILILIYNSIIFGIFKYG